ncbi:MAG: hypothetical protein EBQ58_01425 [Betaproteobacteria bacterium]|nr:hypothetical protein [Betaproteobacteria bacterium]
MRSPQSETKYISPEAHYAVMECVGDKLNCKNSQFKAYSSVFEPTRFSLILSLFLRTPMPYSLCAS